MAFLRSLKRYPEIIIAGIFVGLVCFASIYLLFNSYRASAFDLGLFAESIKNMSLYNNMEGYNHLAVHFSPILYTVVPFYKIFPHPQTLLIMQAILVGFGAYLVYYLANYLKLNRRMSLTFEILYCVNPLVWGVVLFDFHEVAFAIPLLLLVIIGILQKRPMLFAVSLFFSLLVKEDITLIIGALGLSLLIFDFLKYRIINRYAVVIVCSAVIALGLAVVISTLLSKGDDARIIAPFAIRYGNNFIVWFGNFIDTNSMILVFAYLAPLLFYSLGAIEWVIPALVILVMSMTSTWWGQHMVLGQYPAGAIPFLFTAAMVTVSKRVTSLFNNKAIVVCLIIVSIGITFMPNNRGALLTFPNKHTQSVDAVLSKVPIGASITANNWLQPHLVSRKDVYLAPMVGFGSDKSVWGFPLKKTEYVVIDNVIIQGDWESSIVGRLEEAYTIIYELDGCKLYQLRSK